MFANTIGKEVNIIAIVVPILVNIILSRR